MKLQFINSDVKRLDDHSRNSGLAPVAETVAFIGDI
jgi:hypothetical protein